MKPVRYERNSSLTVDGHVLEDLGPMLTIGSERVIALRVTKGRLGRNGHFHDNQPDIFWIVRWQRRSWRG